MISVWMGMSGDVILGAAQGRKRPHLLLWGCSYASSASALTLMFMAAPL